MIFKQSAFMCKIHKETIIQLCSNQNCTKLAQICQNPECKKLHQHPQNTFVKIQDISNRAEKINAEISRISISMLKKAQEKYSVLLQILQTNLQKVKKEYQLIIASADKLSIQDDEAIQQILEGNFNNVSGKQISFFVKTQLSKNLEKKFKQFDENLKLKFLKYDELKILLESLLKKNTELKKKSSIPTNIPTVKKITENKKYPILKTKTSMPNLLQRKKSIQLQIIDHIKQQETSSINQQNLLSQVQNNPLAQIKMEELNQRNLNQLKKIQQSISNETLDLYKKLKAPQDIILLSYINCNNIVYLYLNNNKIQSIQGLAKTSFSSLKILRLSFNQIKNLIPFSKMKFPKLETLSLPSNQIEKLDGLTTNSFPNLKQLTLYNNEIKNIEPLTKLFLSKLEELNLSDNLIQNLYHFTRINFPNLIKLDITKNSFTSTDFNSLRNVIIKRTHPDCTILWK